MPLGVPRLVYELKSVAVEVGDVSGIVARSEVGAICGFPLVGTAGFDCRCVGRVDQLIAVADNSKVKTRLTGFAVA